MGGKFENRATRGSKQGDTTLYTTVPKVQYLSTTWATRGSKQGNALYTTSPLGTAPDNYFNTLLFCPPFHNIACLVKLSLLTQSASTFYHHPQVHAPGYGEGAEELKLIHLGMKAH